MNKCSNHKGEGKSHSVNKHMIEHMAVLATRKIQIRGLACPSASDGSTCCTGLEKLMKSENVRLQEECGKQRLARAWARTASQWALPNKAFTPTGWAGWAGTETWAGGGEGGQGRRGTLHEHCCQGAKTCTLTECQLRERRGSQGGTISSHSPHTSCCAPGRGSQHQRWHPWSQSLQSDVGNYGN